MDYAQSLAECIDLYDFIAYIGGCVLRISAKLARTVFGVVKAPFMLLINGAIMLARFAVRFAKSSFREQVGNEKYFTGRIIRSLKTYFYEARLNPRTAHYLLAHYIRRGMTQYRTLVKYLTLLIIPAGAALLLAVTLGHFSKQCVALRIDTPDGTVGYVASEKDYLAARELAKERLRLNSGAGNDLRSALPDVTYTLELIDINGFTGTQTLCDRLIESSDTNIINACGIYIDDEFLCAVKNEADAKRVFNAFLEASSDYGADGIVTFVQDIDYIEGLYPDYESTVWDPADLAITLASAQEKSDGDFLSVKVVKTEVVNEEIPFRTIEIQSDALYAGSSRTVVNGVNGAAQITNLVTYIDGREVSSQEVSRVTVTEPTDKRVQIGTKAPDSGYVYTQSFGGVFVWPAVNCDNINSPYGWRWGKLHSALDIGSKRGTSLGKLVVAAAEGTVVISGVHSSYGYYVKIDHGNGFQTLYAHCLEGSLMVNPGDHVVAGQAIARVGQSGYATGPHLHFEVRVNGTCVDPGPYLGLY